LYQQNRLLYKKKNVFFISNMDILKELIGIVTPNKLKKINLLIDMDDKSMLKKMYLGYHGKKWKNDEQAANELYGPRYKKDTFFKLKHDLTKKLIQLFPLINIIEDDQWEARNAAFECFTTYHVANLMIRLTNASATAREMMERIFDKCLHYEFTELVIPIAAILTAKYNGKFLNKEKADYYQEIAIRYLTIQMVETKGSIYQSEIYGYYAKDKSVKRFVPERIKGYLTDLNQYDIDQPTQKMLFHKKILEVMYYMTKYNYRKAIEVCEESIAYFEGCTYFNRANIRAFYFQAIAGHTYCREFELGYVKVERCLQIVDEGHYNWFKAQELRINLALYAKKYQDAYIIFRIVTQHDRFNKLPEATKQWWILNEGFLFIFKKMGFVTPDEDHNMQLRFQSFVNKIPIWNGDKRGLNFSVHVLYLFYLITRKEDKYFDVYANRLESLRQYAQRYANTEEMQRSRWIIQILERVGDCGFNPRVYAKDSIISDSLDGLINVPYDITDANLDVESVPFQDIYEYIDLILTNKMTIEKYEFA
jgi:hypothetical protein